MSLHGFPRESTIVNSILTERVEALSGLVSQSTDAEIQSIRSEWERGKITMVKSSLQRLREASRWQALTPKLRAQILRFQSQLELDANNLSRARELASEAGALDPGANNRLLALIYRAEGKTEEALAAADSGTDDESRILKAALHLEQGEVAIASELLSTLIVCEGVTRANSLDNWIIAP